MSEEHQLSEYELKRLERIRQNEAYLESLGLVSHKNKMMQEITKKTKRNQKRAAKIRVVTPGEERRSSRHLKKEDKDDLKLMMLSYYNDDDRVDNIAVKQDDYYSGTAPSPTSVVDLGRMQRESGSDATRPSPSFHAARRRAITTYIDNGVLTEEEKEKLASMDSNYLQKFQEFLVYHNKISDQNVRNVMRQVTKLATGQGIRYDSPNYGWKPNQYFQKGIKITPLSDFVELLELAQQAEDEYGRDHGNGWLLSHPLKKMLLFQQFCLQNPNFLTSKCKLNEYYVVENEDDDDTTYRKDEVHSVIEGDVKKPSAPQKVVLSAKRSLDKKPSHAPAKKRSKTKPDRVPPKKRSTEKSDSDPSKKKSAPTSDGKATEQVGKRIAKKFADGIIYLGTVTKYDVRNKFWWISYDDGDEEEMDEVELNEVRRLYEEENSTAFPATCVTLSKDGKFLVSGQGETLSKDGKFLVS